MSRTQRAAGAAAALALCAALTGCQFLVSQIPDTSTPAPTAPATSGETQVQRQMRLDYAAAEKAYEAATDESGALISRGATRPSPRLRAVSTGEYLRTSMQVAQQVHDAGYSSTGTTVIRGIVDAGWQEKKVLLTACEDVSEVKYFKNGKQVKTNSTPYYVQHVTVVKTDTTTWKVSRQATTQLKSLKGQPCVNS